MLKVSIILPTYNGSKYISAALNSVLNQTFKDWELLVIDDGSTDNVQKIIEEFIQKDTRIFYIKNQKNLGLQKTLNRGISLARGEYIARIDDDDEWIDNTKIAQQVTLLEANKDIVLVGTLFNSINESGKVIKTLKLPLSDKDIRSELLYRNTFGHSTVMFRKETAASLGGYSEDKKELYMEDYDLWLRMGTVGKLANISAITTNYLLRDGLAKKASKFNILIFRLRSIIFYSNFYTHKLRAICHIFSKIISAGIDKI